MDMSTTVTKSSTDDPQRMRGGQALFGVAVMFIGVGILADRLNLWRITLSPNFWPFIPLAFGLARIIDPPEREGRRSRRSGAWLVYIGIWGLLSEYGLFGFHYGNSWPLLIIAVGINMVWRSLEPPPLRGVGEQ